MKEIAQKDPAEQFPVLDRSLSNDSLSSSASTVKVISESAKLVEENSFEHVATANDHEPDELTGSDKSSIEDNEVIVHKVSIVQKALVISHTFWPDLFCKGPRLCD